MKVAVIGLGLIGGSLALALKKYTTCAVVGYDACQATLELAVASQAVDAVVPTMEEAADEADVVIFAIAPGLIGEAVRQIAPSLKPGSVISDVASAKGPLWEHMVAVLPPGVSYIAGHPMAGSEKSGFAAAHAELFRGRPYILMHQTGATPEALTQLTELAVQIGAVPIVLDSALHDPAVAAISHVPHIAAAALTLLAGEGATGALNLTLAAGGFRDMTRVASGNPAMWSDICITNRTALANSLEEFQHILEHVRLLLLSGEKQGLTDFFARAKEIRDGCQSNFISIGR